ncbi:unnamed protein product [Fusarium langsethiae]|nr:unnamed protein product [Fusarium langsethiae]
MHHKVIEAWLCGIIPDQLPSEAEIASLTFSEMNDGSPTKEHRGGRGQTRQQFPIREQSSATMSPVRRSARVRNLRGTTGGNSSSDDFESDHEPTPRPARGFNSRDNTSASFTGSLSKYHDMFDPATVASSRSSPSKHSSASGSKRSSSPLKNMASLENAGITYEELSHKSLLGVAGKKLYQDLDIVSDHIGVFPAQICDDISEAMDHSVAIREHHKNVQDSRDIEQLRRELHEVKMIHELSGRCSSRKEGEAEWNNAVHSAVLRLVFGPNNFDIGWKYITNAKIDSQYLPVMPNGLPCSSRMVDYVIFIGDQRDSSGKHLEHEISRFIISESDAINHTPYVALRHCPILIGIETKTINRTENEARLQLGIWVASHIRRIWALCRGLSNHDAGRLKDTIEEMVFPLIYVQSSSWFLMLARTSITMGAEPGREVQVVIYRHVILGETSTIKSIYQLVAGLCLLRTWGNSVFRNWWETILDIVSN